MSNRALLTDFYELTMAAGYFERGKSGDTATFDLYFRQNPFHGGYAIAAGLEDAICDILETRFEREDLLFLSGMHTPRGTRVFSDTFLEYLEDYSFRGSIRAMPEGSVCFSSEPLVEVSGKLIECQMIESILLCHINFQTLVATKAARMWEASNRGSIVEFGMRRAHGPDGALSASRAAYIGGAEATSNVLGSRFFGVPARGTQAHSWIQAFPSELDAFRDYARTFPEECVLLVDTYDVLESGLPNAITAARELEQSGHRLAGIRIDSGDLAFLSQRARERLDQAGLDYVKIIVSNELDEFLISEILAEGGRIDAWGVGTKLVSGDGADGGALGGVYKMVEHNGRPKIKLSNNPVKTTNPGAKRVTRFYNSQGLMEADAVGADSEEFGEAGVLIIDPHNPLRRKRLFESRRSEMLEPVVTAGRRVSAPPSPEEIRNRRRHQLDQLHESYKRLRNPHEYKVGLSLQLWEQKERLLNPRMA